MRGIITTLGSLFSMALAIGILALVILGSGCATVGHVQVTYTDTKGNRIVYDGPATPEQVVQMKLAVKTEWANQRRIESAHIGPFAVSGDKTTYGSDLLPLSPRPMFQPAPAIVSPSLQMAQPVSSPYIMGRPAPADYSARIGQLEEHQSIIMESMTMGAVAPDESK